MAIIRMVTGTQIKVKETGEQIAKLIGGVGSSIGNGMYPAQAPFLLDLTERNAGLKITVNAGYIESIRAF